MTGKSSLGMRLHTGLYIDNNPSLRNYTRIFLSHADNEPANIELKVYEVEKSKMDKYNLILITFAYDDINSFETARKLIKKAVKRGKDVRLLGLKADLN